MSKWWRKVLCVLGVHLRVGEIVSVKGRPHLDAKSGEIIGRDPPIVFQDCLDCDYRNWHGGPPP